MSNTGPRSQLRGLVCAVATAITLCGCINATFQVRPTMIDEQAYTALYPYFAEYCAVSEFSKKKGFGIALDSGGPGGHSVFYLNGACRVRDAGYPELALCDGPPDQMAGHGVGISVNEHYQNANWVATEGRAFFFDGDIAPGEGVTRAGYARTQDRAKAQGILDGIVFGEAALADRPAGRSERDFMYEVSIGTDYAIGLARDRYCARVPLDRRKMDTIVRHLNALNAPYRSGREAFHWNVLRDNCAYLAHNALAAVGLWPVWPTNRPLLVAVFSFPVPKNEFVNLMRRTNDMPIADPDALFDDDQSRAAVSEQGWLLTQPGALAEARPAMQPNDIYNTNLRLIFYDEAIFGHYQQRFEAIFQDLRYTDLTANLRYFSALYTTILAQPHPPGATPIRAAILKRYDDAIGLEKRAVDQSLARLADLARHGT